MRAFKRWSLHSGGASLAAALVAAAIVWLAWPVAVPEFAAVKATWTPSEAYLLDRNGEVIDQERIDLRVRRFEWTPLDAVSPALDRSHRRWRGPALLAARRCRLAAVLSAVRDHGVSREARRGASTITMQVAALLGPERARRLIGRRLAAQAARRCGSPARSSRTGARRRSSRPISTCSASAASCRASRRRRTSSRQGAVGLTLPRALVLAALLPSPRASADAVAARACAQRGSQSASRCDCSGGSRCGGIRCSTSSGTDRPSCESQLAPQLAHCIAERAGRACAHHARLRACSGCATNVLREHLAATRGAQRSRRRGARGRQRHRRRAGVGRRQRRPQSSARDVDGVRAQPAGGLDAEAVPVRARARAALPHGGLAARRLAARARHGERPVPAAELRPGLQRPGQRAHGARQLAQRAGGAHARAGRRRAVPRAAACARLRRLTEAATTTATRWRSAPPRSASGSWCTPTARSRAAGAPRRSARRSLPQRSARTRTAS